jgi:hypothetical protein
MQAYSRVGYEAMKLHGARLSRLEEQAPKVRVFTLLFKLFRNEKWTPFKTNCLRNFDTKSSRIGRRTAPPPSTA